MIKNTALGALLGVTACGALYVGLDMPPKATAAPAPVLVEKIVEKEVIKEVVKPVFKAISQCKVEKAVVGSHGVTHGIARKSSVSAIVSVGTYRQYITLECMDSSCAVFNAVVQDEVLSAGQTKQCSVRYNSEDESIFNVKCTWLDNETTFKVDTNAHTVRVISDFFDNSERQDYTLSGSC